MKKKRIIIISVILCVFIILGITTGYLDYKNVKNSIEPKYTIKLVDGKNGKITYLGLGYKVVRYTAVSPREPFANSLKVNFRGWFVGYELSKGDYKFASSLKKVDYASTEILVRFDNVLYGKSNTIIDYQVSSEKTGTIDKLINSKYIPKLNNETNIEEILNADVYDKTNTSIVLKTNVEYVLFEKINE